MLVDFHICISVPLRKGVLRNFTKFTGFLVRFAKFFSTPFFIEHLRWLLLYLDSLLQLKYPSIWKQTIVISFSKTLVKTSCICNPWLNFTFFSLHAIWLIVLHSIYQNVFWYTYTAQKTKFSVKDFFSKCDTFGDTFLCSAILTDLLRWIS